METVNPSQITREKEIFAQIGRDMRLLIGRVSQVERNANVIPELTPLAPLPLPSLANQLPITTNPASDIDLGFVDLRLGAADWSQWDVQFDGQDLQTDASLETAILISVWTDAQHNGERGWWGDAYNTKPVAESLLWTLLGKPANDTNVALGIEYVKKACQWLLDDEWLSALQVTGEAQRDPASGLHIFAFRLDHTDRHGTRGVLYL
jgi:phage gp46-like protein